jgi:hypothetical protein
MDFVKFLESCDPKLHGFFDILFRVMNLKEKNKKTGIFKINWMTDARKISQYINSDKSKSAKSL